MTTGRRGTGGADSGSEGGHGNPQPTGRSGDAPAHAGRPGSPDDPVCDVCGTEMYEIHCKLICPRCGYQRDCSDP